jgi:8-oxo-dGTP diphosphatase
MENWRVFAEEKQKDSKKVAKVIIYNDKNEVLFIKRSNYNKKFVGEWDLPGGHAHEGEPMEEACRRETKEETNLTIKSIKKVKESGRDTYFIAKYDGGDIKLSEEHTEFLFRDVKEIKGPDKYEKVAQTVMEALENE